MFMVSNDRPRPGRMQAAVANGGAGARARSAVCNQPTGKSVAPGQADVDAVLGEVRARVTGVTDEAGSGLAEIVSSKACT